MTSTVEHIIRSVEAAYPLGLAAEWDSVGLVCGDPKASVSTILLAIDPVMSVVDEAMDVGADLVVTHHPLFLHGVHSVAPTTPKGSVVHTLLTHGLALYCAHTNADHANPGVSDSLARACGLGRTETIDPPGEATGTGRVGSLDKPITVKHLAVQLAQVLPSTAHGIRIAGDPNIQVKRVAVCGGAGDSLLDQLVDVDVYVTSDLRHHRAQDYLARTGRALIDVPHWAAEWLWLPDLADVLSTSLEGDNVLTIVSRTDTSPWRVHVGGHHEGQS